MRSALLIAIGLVLALPASAIAKPRVAVVVFEGDPGGAAQDAVTDALGEDVMLIGPKQVNRAVDRLGLDTTVLGEKDLRKLSKELSADAVLQGKYSKKDGVRLLRFKLFVHGKKKKGFKVEFASLKSKKFKSSLHDAMLERIEGTAPAADDAVAAKKPAEDDEAAALTTMKKKKGDDDTEAKTKGGEIDVEAATKKKHTDDEEDTSHKKKVASADDDSDSVSAHVEVKSKSTARSANRVGFRFDFGASLQNRTLTFSSRDYPQAPKPFDQKPVPGARFALELYPLAFGGEGVGSGLGIGGMYDQTLSLSLQSSAQPGSKFPVTQRRFDVGPRFRLVFGHTETSPALTFGVGYMQREFVVNRGALVAGNTIDLPDVKYVGFDPGIDFRIPLTSRIALTLGGQAILLTSAGPIQELDSYGQAKILGGTGTLSLDFIIGKHVGFNLRGELTQMGYTFTGNGVMTNNRDMMPSSPDIGGAADRYIGGVGTIAVLY